MTAAATGTGTGVVPLSAVTVGEAEVEAVSRVLRSGWLSAGAETAAFEDAFAARAGAEGAVMVSSGTAALHLALLAAGVEPGTEVITPSLTFVAGAAMTRLIGAEPVFVDIVGGTDLTVDPAAVEAAITPRTRAVIVTHFAGWSAALAAVAGTCRRHGVALIEDSAHAPLVSGGSGVLGTVGDFGCFSFYSSKNLTTGEGGLVLARDPADREQIRRMRSHRMTTTALERDRGGPAYDVDGVGFNYRPTEIAAALGRVQLDRLDADRAARRRVADRYRQGLAGSTVLSAFADRDGDTAHHLQVVILPEGTDRDVVRAGLRREGVLTGVHYPPTHLFSAYRRSGPGPDLGRTEAVAARILSLPCHALLTSDDVDRVCRALLAVVSGSAAGR